MFYYFIMYVLCDYEVFWCVINDYGNMWYFCLVYRGLNLSDFIDKCIYLNVCLDNYFVYFVIVRVVVYDFIFVDLVSCVGIDLVFIEEVIVDVGMRVNEGIYNLFNCCLFGVFKSDFLCFYYVVFG